MPRFKPTKILFCIDALARGGTELQLLGLLKRLDRTRFTPVLCTIRPATWEFELEDCEHLQLHVPRLVSPAGFLAVWRMARWLRRNEVEIVHTFFQDASVFCGTAAWLARTPCRVAGFRDMGFWSGAAEARLTKAVYGLMTGFLANAQAVKNHFVAHFGVAADKVVVVPNGIDTEVIPWTEQAGPTLNVGIVGNLNRRVKRTDLFIEAAARVAANYPEVCWHIIGEGHLHRELADLAKTRDLTENIVFAGSITDVPAYLAQLQVAVLCSDSEGFSNALLEYMLAGCAVVATDVGGNPEAVQNEKTGLLVPPDNAEALAAAMERLVADVALRKSMAHAARSFVEEQFEWSVCVAAHEEYYGKCR